MKIFDNEKEQKNYFDETKNKFYQSGKTFFNISSATILIAIIVAIVKYIVGGILL
jgi:hypothetical protein